MDFIQHLQTWTKADIDQGKWMIGIAIIIILPVCFLFAKNGNLLQKGMLVPLGLLFMMNLGYGGYLMFSRPKYREQTKEIFQTNPQETIDSELIKTKSDHKSYTITKYIWAGLLILSVGCFFMFNKEYIQGLSLGFAVMFLGMLLIDVFLHQRLKIYMRDLSGYGF
ncbi:hypothetical protein [Chryseobacterium wangxinyae]|uniref:hypothetical protein n=1 Tax=Chryseobacterium sp. CY353 TaxID=2997334 RepID=UPI00226DC3D7|nr:hypothetical protein [Chryseobacterium sp. CY353]MCY0967611.1 hypothetical protein [Chryseobacterium sp. CY353]